MAFWGLKGHENILLKAFLITLQQFKLTFQQLKPAIQKLAEILWYNCSIFILEINSNINNKKITMKKLIKNLEGKGKGIKNVKTVKDDVNEKGTKKSSAQVQNQQLELL